MSRFLGLAVQTDVRCASGSTVAAFRPDELLACTAVLSPTEPESLTFAIGRDDARAAEIVVGRVVRTLFGTSAEDREWDIVEVDDASADGRLTVTAQAIGLRLGRAVYVGANATTGAAELAFDDASALPTALIDDRILPALAAAGMSWIVRGTVDSTRLVDLSGEWSTALEVVQALCEPGRANAEWQLRRNGDTDYRLDLLTTIGGSAATVAVRTRVNLLETRRERAVRDLATRLVPRGSDQGSQRTMADHLWRVKTVVDGTWLELEDIQGGAGPLAYDDQVNGLYFAVLNSHTFSSQAVADSVAATQRIQVASTAGISAGQWGRFFRGSGANGARVTSLTNPTAAAAPASGGYGDRARILDRPALRGDCNLVPNPWMRAYASATDAPDDWTDTAGTPANRTVAREATIVRDGAPYSCRFTTSGATTLSLETPDIRVWAIAERRHVAALWFNVQAVPAAAGSALILELITSGGTLIEELARWVRGEDPLLDTWTRFEPEALDLSGITGAVRLRVRVATTTGASAASGWDVVFGPAVLAESEVSVTDIEYSGGTALWQEANAALPAASAIVRGYDLRLLDLERDDPTTYAVHQLVPGGSVAVQDTDLGETVTLRVLELRPDYLNPIATELRLGAAAPDPSAVTTPAAAPATTTPRAAREYTRCDPRRTGLTDDECEVTVGASAPSGTPSVRLVSLGSGATIASGAALNELVAAGAVWEFTRPGYGEASAVAVFESVLNDAVTNAASIEIPAQGAVPAWLSIQHTVSDTEVVITWDGAPEVKVEINGTGFRTPATSPITVPRDAHSGGVVKTYVFRAIGDAGDTVTHAVQVPKQDPILPDLARIDTASFTDGDTPGDGGGSVEISITTSNMPVGVTYDITLTKVAGAPITADSGGDTGVTTFPHTVSMALGTGAELHCLIEAFDGATLIAQKEFTALVP